MENYTIPLYCPGKCIKLKIFEDGSLDYFPNFKIKRVISTYISTILVEGQDDKFYLLEYKDGKLWKCEVVDDEHIYLSQNYPNLKSFTINNEEITLDDGWEMLIITPGKKFYCIFYYDTYKTSIGSGKYDRYNAPFYCLIIDNVFGFYSLDFDPFTVFGAQKRELKSANNL